jgi:hypothetical protein
MTKNDVQSLVTKILMTHCLHLICSTFENNDNDGDDNTKNKNDSNDNKKVMMLHL